MNSVLEKQHPSLGVMVRSTGEVLIPASQHLKEHWTKGWWSKNGYLNVKINKKTYLVHRLVAETFIENLEGKHFVDHISRDRTDNSVVNLRWVTKQENNRNTLAFEECEKKWGVHPCDNLKEYHRLWYQEHKKVC